MGYGFHFHGEDLIALPSGALHLPRRALLVVSDLHFGKAERLARRGGAFLPPYETRATLTRLDTELERTGARMVVCLGDSFDDLDAARGLEAGDRLWLLRLMAGRDWTWILGNHDAGPTDLGGTHRAELRLGSLMLRHIATSEQAELSGHYHPKAYLAGRSHPCFLIDRARVILPAFGTYVGGLPATDPALAALMSAEAIAVLTGRQALAIPMPRGETRRGPAR